MRFLLVDDDKLLAKTIAMALSEITSDIDIVYAAEDALPLLEEHAFDLALLDLSLPGMSGDDLMRCIARNWPSTSVIILTAYPSTETAIAAVRHDAVDYLQKPFKSDELRASVRKALAKRETQRRLRKDSDRLRRVERAISDEHEAAPPYLLVAGALSLDPVRREVCRDGELLDLTGLQYRMLLRLMRTPGQPVSPAELGRATEPHARNDVRSFVRYHIHRLRERVEPDPADPKLIQTVKDAGYRVPE